MFSFFSASLKDGAGYPIHAPGGTHSIHDGGSDGASYCEPRKIYEPEILHPPKIYPASNCLNQNNARIKYVNTDLFNQTDSSNTWSNETGMSSNVSLSSLVWS